MRTFILKMQTDQGVWRNKFKMEKLRGNEIGRFVPPYYGWRSNVSSPVPNISRTHLTGSKPHLTLELTFE